ncbi:MAG: ATP-binding protein [Porticoccaceae bacterium]
MFPTTGDFDALLERLTAALQSEQRISYRGLKRRFQLSDEDIEDIKDELIHARQLAVDEDNKVLVWRSQVAPAASVKAPAAAYTPRHLAEKILSARSAIEGENKQVTVLFCDVVESMVLAERLGAEDWHEVLNDFFVVLTGAVHALEGTVNQYTGDGVMALFGAPIAAEDHARRACLAALKIHDSIVPLNARVQREYGLTFAVRIGLNSGEVVVGSIGDDLRMDYTAQGQVVGIAARLEAMADANDILMSEFCQRQVIGLCEVASLGRRRIKGVTKPLEVFQLHSVAIDANRFEASRQRGLTRFVGREDDLATLDNALMQARAGNGQVVGVVAEAGTGKSRLCHEFLERCRGGGMTVLSGQAVSHGIAVPYLPMLQIFRTFFGIDERDHSAGARKKISGRLLALGNSGGEVAPLVFELLGVADPGASAQRIDPDARQRQLLTLPQLIIGGAGSGNETIVTCIEDLHWLDPTSAQFLERWIDALAGSRHLLVVSFRPEYDADWMRKLPYCRVTLAPLASDAIRDMLVDLLGADPSTAGLADEIFRRTGGNPFFCEEIVQSLRESGDLSLAPAHYRLNRPLHQLQIPASVQSVLSARIDRLGEDDKALLQLAAVIGREFSVELIRHLSGQEWDALSPALNRLKHGEFIFEPNPGARTLYSFKHALTQEVALNSQLRDKRRQAHSRVAASLEALFADTLDEQSAMIAYHREHAREPLAAAQAYARAAAHIRGSNRSQQMQYIQKMLALTADLPVSDQRQQIRLQGLVELVTGGAWRFTMSDDELEILYSEGRALAEAAGLADIAIMIRAARAAALGMMAGNVRNWSLTIDDIVAHMDGVSAEVAGSLLGNCSYSLYVRGRLELGLEQAQMAQDMAKGDVGFGQAMGFSVLVTCMNNGALLLSAAGQLDAALAMNRKGIALATAAGLTEELIWHLANKAEETVPRGLSAQHPLVSEVVADSARGYALAEQVASDFTRGVAKRSRAISLFMQGDYAGAEVAALECLNHCRQYRAHLEVEARCLALLSDAQLRCGKHVEARISARQAITVSQAQGVAYFECLGQLSLVQALLADAGHVDIELVTQALERALQLVDASGGGALRPQVMEQRARLAAKRGQRGRARDDLIAALAGYREISAAGHAERIAIELSASA